MSRLYSLEFSYKIVCIEYRFSKPVVLHRGKNTLNKFIEAILEEYDYYKKNNKTTFLLCL